MRWFSSFLKDSIGLLRQCEGLPQVRERVLPKQGCASFQISILGIPSFFFSIMTEMHSCVSLIISCLKIFYKYLRSQSCSFVGYSSMWIVYVKNPRLLLSKVFPRDNLFAIFRMYFVVCCKSMLLSPYQVMFISWP